MARDLFINTDSGSIETAVVSGLTQPRKPIPMWTIVDGETQGINLYLVKSNGTYDDLSGSSEASVKVSITKPDAEPANGTFTLIDSLGAETSAINYSASASAVESALNALNNYSGFRSDIFVVSGAGTTAANGTYRKDGTHGGKIRVTIEGGATNIDSIKWETVDSSWKIYESGNYVYSSFDNVSDPSLVTNWTATIPGINPVPTITNTATLVDVSKQKDSFYSVIARTAGETSALTGKSINLTPESSITSSISIAGDATTRAQQIIEVRRQPAIYTSTWSTITNGFSGTFDANTARLAQAIIDTPNDAFMMEIKVNGDAIARVPCRVASSGMTAASFPATNLP